MALTNAERQKRYREKLAKSNEKYRFQMWLSAESSKNLYRLSKRSKKPLKDVDENRD